LNEDEKQPDNPITNNAILLKEKLLRECVSIAESINNGYPMVTKICKVLINKARDADIDTGLLLEYLAFRFCLNELINRRANLRENNNHSQLTNICGRTINSKPFSISMDDKKIGLNCK